LQSLSKTEPLNAFYTIQSWLRTSTQIDELDPQSRRLHSSFVELWQRIASGGMLELANSLPEDVAAHYQTDRNRWGQYEDIYRDLSDDLITKLSAVGEPVLWEEFNVRRTPRQVIMAHIGQTEARWNPPRDPSIAASLRNRVEMVCNRLRRNTPS
jgi:hypothetical protein